MPPTTTVSAIGGNWWDKRILVTDFAEGELGLEPFDDLAEHLREPMQEVLRQKAAFQIKFTVMWDVEIDGRSDKMRHEQVSRVADLANYGRDANGQIDLNAIVLKAKQRAEARVEMANEHGSDIQFIKIDYIEVTITSTSRSRRIPNIALGM